MVKPLVAGFACMAIVACGSSQRAAMAPASTANDAAGAPSQMAPLDDPHAEIDRLSHDIDVAREGLGLAAPAPTPMPAPAEAMAAVPLSTDATCQPAETDRCTQSCKVSDSICNNAQRICDLAKDLAGDGWAAGKCATAKETCATAHESCCTCQ
jgi:hypothetical protein